MALRVSHPHLVPTDSEHQEDLSREQMRALLQRAEDRMRAAVTAEPPNDNVVHLQEFSRAEATQLIPRYLKVCAENPYR